MAPARRSRVTSHTRAKTRPTVRAPLDEAALGAQPRQLPRAPATRPRWLRAILEQMPSGVLIAESPSGTIVFWNEQATKTWPNFLPVPDGLDGLSRCQLIHPDGRPYAPEEWPLARVVQTGVSEASEQVEFVSDNGTRTVIDVRCTPVRDDKGQISAVIAILQDVTDRKRTEQALEASRARYENLYQDAPDMFASVTVDTECIVQCNQTLVSTTGYAREELLGRPVRDLHHPTSWPALAKALERVRHAGRARAELQLTCKSGEVIDVSLSMAAIRDERGALYYRSTWRNITDRKRAEVVLQQQRAQLERSRTELQALAGRLLTAQEDERRLISRELHDDINQRLALLTLDMEALYQRLPPSRRATAERLRGLRDRVVQLSDDVHRLAYQLHTSILDDLGLPAALQSYVTDYTRREGIPIELTQGQPLDPIPPDAASCLYRVTQEALRNVAKHAHAKQVTLRLESSAGGIKIVIADDGVGFDAGDTQHRRSGLGVVGMQERVRLVGGRFKLASRPGGGTVVEVWVPLPEADA